MAEAVDNNRWVATECGCIHDQVMGKKRPRKCDCGHFYVKPQAGSTSPPRPALKRTRRRETPAEREAREHFNTVVKSYPCWFRVTRPCGNCDGAGEVETLLEGDYAKAICAACGGDGRHHCSGERDAHHVVPKQFIRRMFQAVLPEPQFVAILFNPKIGAPVCRYGAHEPIEKKQARIFWGDLSEECVEYVGSLPDFMLIELERQCPKRETVS